MTTLMKVSKMPYNRLTWQNETKLLYKLCDIVDNAHRRRDRDLVKTHGPRIKEVPKNVKNNGLSNETSLERIGRDHFVSRFYTKIVQKTEKYKFSKLSKK
jgi:hypothetical protein